MSDADNGTSQQSDPTAAVEQNVCLQERISRLPREPGVYQFCDASGHVLYVGKAQDLRSRVRSYFVRGGDGRPRIERMVPRIADVEVVATATVKDALLLENQLIKQHRPRFNVRLRDDKNYLGLRLDPSETYPRITETRRFRSDGALYFGPYTSSASLRETLGSLQRIFPLRTCSQSVFESYRRRGRPCLEHALGRCCAPCCEPVEAGAYAELVAGAVRLLKGQAGDLVRELRARMEQASADEEYELAGRLRDRIYAIERTFEQQSTVSARFVDRDVFAVAREGRRAEIQALHVRAGKLMGGFSYPFGDVHLELDDMLDSFLAQYYATDRALPSEILLPVEVESGKAIEALLSERAGRSVRLICPRRGERRRLLEMAERNARLALAERMRSERSETETLEELRHLLGLPEVPRSIECYDTSHLQGCLHVGSRVSFRGIRPYKGGYRRYKLREAAPGDDYAALREILVRRLERRHEDPLPDLLLLDGGKGQLEVVRAVAADLGVGPVALASLAKERDGAGRSGRVLRHGGTKQERVFLPGIKDPLVPPPSSPALLLLQRIRDESHRFAIRYHRELRRKLGTRSILDELPGIGPVKRRALLRQFGSLERIKRASEAELSAMPKLSTKDAKLIASFFAAERTGEGEPGEGDPGEVKSGTGATDACAREPC